MIAAMMPFRRARHMLRTDGPGTRTDIIQMLGVDVTALQPVGSRVTCDPAPVGTDEDWLVLLDHDADVEAIGDVLRAQGFGQDGQPQFYTGNDAGGFRSWRRGELNIVATQDPHFYDLFVTATTLAKRFNLLDKGDRIALFQAILYGVRSDNLEWARESADVL